MPSRSSVIVTALTTAAVAVVGVLAYQASASIPDRLKNAADRPAVTASPTPGPSDEGKGRSQVPVPGDSGQGKRVVYSLSAKRVWLVAEDGKVVRTFEVAPSTVNPAPGTYKVIDRDPSVTGSDGVPVEHVIKFATVGHVVVGFSAALDGSMPDPNSPKKTGGIREKRDDGSAMWDFAAKETQVVVLD
ncbi:hypothetical protein [Streptomyces sp. NPDC003077]|uniref:hypothetical protein n=1 Tax=Streptomyces sp. NPDC003077 TaxID=3154443 RepID=UPI0033A644FA